jgi:PAS domain S-box-containing protein
MKILYVEDEFAHVILAQRTLEESIQQPFVLLHAETMTEALSMLEEGPDIDLVLSDLRLPDGTGLDLLKKIRQREKAPAVVLVTGQGDQEVAVAALKSGAADYLVKQSDYLLRLPVVISNAIAQNRLAMEQEALRQAEVKYQSLVEHIAAVVFLESVEGDGPPLYISPRIEELTGYSVEDWCSVPDMRSSRLHPDDRERILVADANSAQTGSRFFEEYRLIRQDESIIWVKEDTNLIRDKDGVPLYRQGILLDITKEEEALELIQKSEERFRRIFHASPIATCVVRAEDGRFIDANQSYLKLVGRPIDALLNSSAIEIGLWRNEEEQTAFIDNLNKNGAIQGVEYQVKDVPAGPRDTLAYYELIELGGQICILAMFYDVTEEKKVQKELEAERDFALQVLNNMGQGLTVTAQDGRFEYINPAYARMVGFAPEEILGKALRDFTTEAGRKDVDDRKVLRDGVPSTYESLLLYQNSQEVPALITEVPRKEDGRVTGTIAVITDLTDRKKTEEALARQVKELTILHSVAVAQAESRSEDELLERVTKIIGQIYKDACGFLLLNEKGDCLSPHSSYISVSMAGSQGSIPISASTIGEAVIDEKIIRVGNIRNEGDYSSIVSGILAELSIPIRVNGRIVGVLEVASTTSNAFGENDERFLNTISSSVGTALERLRIFREEQRRSRELNALYYATKSLAQTLKVEVIAENLVSTMDELLGYEYASLYLLDDDERHLIPLAISQKLRHLRAQERVDQSPDQSNGTLGEGIIGWVAEHGQPLCTGDVEAEPRYQRMLKGIKSELCVPLIARGKVIGVLNIEAPIPDAYGEDDESLLTALANSAAISLENARLYQDALEAAERRAVLHRISQDIVRFGQDFEQIYMAIHEAAEKLMSCDVFIISLCDESTSSTVSVYTVENGKRLEAQRIPQDQGIGANVINEGKSIAAKNEAEIVKLDPIRFGSSRHVQSLVAVPMRVSNRIIGMISAQCYEQYAYGAEEQVLLEMLAAHAATAIENGRLFEEQGRRSKIIEALADIANEIATTRDVQAALDQITHRALDLLNANHVSIHLLQDDHVTLKAVSAHGAYRENLLSYSIKSGEGITGNIFLKGKPEIIHDMSLDTRRVTVPGTPKSDAVLESMMCAPLILRGKSIGVINAWRLKEIGLFNETELNFLVGIAHQVSICIESGRLFHETNRQAQEAAAIAEVGRDISSTLNLNIVLERIVSYAMELLNAETSAVFLTDTSTSTLRAIATLGRDSEELKHHSLPIGTGIIGTIAQQNVGEIVNDTLNDPRAVTVQGTEDEPFEHIMGVPIVLKDKNTGLLAVWRSGLGTDFAPRELNFLTSLARQTAVAIENARLYDETQRRIKELEIINRVSTSMRMAQSMEEMLPILLTETMALLDTSNGSIWMYSHTSNMLVQKISHGASSAIAYTSLSPIDGIVGHTFTSGKRYIADDLKNDPLLSSLNRESITPGLTGIFIPIQSTAGPVGVLVIGVPQGRQLTEELNLFTILAEITGNSIHRVQLFEQSQMQVRRLTTLRDIDAAITSSFDLRLTLNILMDQTLNHLNVDAVQIGLYQTDIQSLTYLASAGFQAPNPTRPQVRLGEGLAGQVIVKQSILHVVDLQNAPETRNEPLIRREGFATYIGIPLIVKGQIKGVFEIFHRSPLSPTLDWMEFLHTLAGQAAIAIDSSQLFENLQRSNQELRQAYDTTLEGWARALELRDRETEGHTRRVTKSTLDLARFMNVSDKELVNINRGVLLHDIGKMGVPDHILKKTGSLNEEEWHEMRQHPIYAYNLLSPISYLRGALDIPYCHHEHWDGSGYPRGLKGEQIPLSARIFSVIDIWDALLSDRPYRKAWPSDKVANYLRQVAGTILDPSIVEIFFKMIAAERHETD